LVFDQGALEVYAAVSVALVGVFGVLLIISLLHAVGRIHVPRRAHAALLGAVMISVVAAVVAALLAVLL
jgi:hypothetical protein